MVLKVTDDLMADKTTPIHALLETFEEDARQNSDWESAAKNELDRLVVLEHYHKRRNTVVALVDTRLAGGSEEDVWRRPDTCSRNTYHSKWKHQALFVEVLDKVERIAREWKDTDELRALRSASRRMALASPSAASKAIAQLDSSDGQVVLRAAFGILDRASQETARKGEGNQVSVTVVSAADRIAALQRAQAAEVADD